MNIRRNIIFPSTAAVITLRAAPKARAAAGQGRGLFTYYLLKNLNDRHGASKAKDLFGAVTK